MKPETPSALLSAAVPRPDYPADRHEPLPLLLLLLHWFVSHSGGGFKRRFLALDQPRVTVPHLSRLAPLLPCVSLPRLLGMVHGRGEDDEDDACGGLWRACRAEERGGGKRGEHLG